LSCNELLKQQQKIFDRLNSLEKRVDQLLASKNVKKIEKQASSFKRIDRKQNVSDCLHFFKIFHKIPIFRLKPFEILSYKWILNMSIIQYQFYFINFALNLNVLYSSIHMEPQLKM
jgi:hypothetical protein